MKDQFSIAYNPHFNDVAKSKNQHPIEFATCMMQAINVLNVFWIEAGAMAAYMINRCPMEAVEVKELGGQS